MERVRDIIVTRDKSIFETERGQSDACTMSFRTMEGNREIEWNRAEPAFSPLDGSDESDYTALGEGARDLCKG